MINNKEELELIKRFDEMRECALKYFDYLEKGKIKKELDVRFIMDDKCITVRKSKHDDEYFAVVFLKEYKVKDFRLFEINTSSKKIFSTSKVVGIYTDRYLKYDVPPSLDETERRKLIELIDKACSAVNNLDAKKKIKERGSRI